MTLGPVDFDNNWADIELFAEQIMNKMQKIASTHTQIFNRTGRQIIDSDQVQSHLIWRRNRTLTLNQIANFGIKTAIQSLFLVLKFTFTLMHLVMPRQTFPLGTVLSAKWIKVIVCRARNLRRSNTHLTTGYGSLWIRKTRLGKDFGNKADRSSKCCTCCWPWRQWRIQAS